MIFFFFFAGGFIFILGTLGALAKIHRGESWGMPGFVGALGFVMMLYGSLVFAG